MENTHAKKSDLSLPFMAIVFAALLLLSGCNLNTGTAPSGSEAPAEESTSDSASDDSAMMEADPAAHNDAVVMESEPEAETMELAADVSAASASNNSGYETGTVQAFDKAKFDEAVANGEKVLLDFHADWCHVCRDNEPLIEKAVDGTDVVSFKINYDSAQDLRAKYGVVSQSTLIVFDGKNEVNRAMGAQSENTLAKLLQ